MVLDSSYNYSIGNRPAHDTGKPNNLVPGFWVIVIVQASELPSLVRNSPSEGQGSGYFLRDPIFQRVLGANPGES